MVKKSCFLGSLMHQRSSEVNSVRIYFYRKKCKLDGAVITMTASITRHLHFLDVNIRMCNYVYIDVYVYNKIIEREIRELASLWNARVRGLQL